MLKHDVGHEDEAIDAVGQQTQLLVELLDVAVDEFGGEADVVAHHRSECRLIVAEGALLAQPHVEAGSGEQRMPEGEVLVHVEYAGNGHDGLALSGLRLIGAVEEQVVFEGIDILALDIVLALVGEHALAFVA